jgi:hypothetical protein
MAKAGARVGQFAPLVVPSQRIDVYVHVESSSVEGKLDQLLKAVNAVLKLEVAMLAELDNLTTEVTRNGEVEASAVLLIKGIAQQLIDAKDDPVKIAALSASLKASADDLAAAVAANTPAA